MNSKIKCLKCNKTEFIEILEFSKLCKKSYDKVMYLKCFHCGENLKMTRFPIDYIGDIQLGDDAIFNL